MRLNGRNAAGTLKLMNGRMVRIGNGILNAGERAGRMGATAIDGYRRGISRLRGQFESARMNAGKLQRSSTGAVGELTRGAQKSARMMRKSAKTMQKSVKRARKEFK